MLAGLSNNIHTSQQYFRHILHAMSEPGTPVTLAQSPVWQQLNAASVGVLLTLCDQNTPVYLSPSLAQTDTSAAVQFHTHAAITHAEAAQFVFVQASEFNAAAYMHGDEIYPEQSATVVIQVEGLTGGTTLTLTGAGIQTEKTIAPVLSEALLDYYRTQGQRYPLGIDTILTCGTQLMAIPRSTRLQEGGSCM